MNFNRIAAKLSTLILQRYLNVMAKRKSWVTMLMFCSEALEMSYIALLDMKFKVFLSVQ